MMAYPTEAQKGTYIGYFWAIFNLGAVVGSAVAFATSFHSMVNHLCYASCRDPYKQTEIRPTKLETGPMYVSPVIVIKFL
jgi:hypothetical protein